MFDVLMQYRAVFFDGAVRVLCSRGLGIGFGDCERRGALVCLAAASTLVWHVAAACALACSCSTEQSSSTARCASGLSIPCFGPRFLGLGSGVWVLAAAAPLAVLRGGPWRPVRRRGAPGRGCTCQPLRKTPRARLGCSAIIIPRNPGRPAPAPPPPAARRTTSPTAPPATAPRCTAGCSTGWAPTWARCGATSRRWPRAGRWRRSWSTAPTAAPPWAASAWISRWERGARARAACALRCVMWHSLIHARVVNVPHTHAPHH